MGFYWGEAQTGCVFRREECATLRINQDFRRNGADILPLLSHVRCSPHRTHQTAPRDELSYMGTESAASQNHKQPLSASPALVTGQQASPLASSSSFVFYRVQNKSYYTLGGVSSFLICKKYKQTFFYFLLRPQWITSHNTLWKPLLYLKELFSCYFECTEKRTQRNYTKMFMID